MILTEIQLHNKNFLESYYISFIVLLSYSSVLYYTTFRSTFLTPAGGTVKAEAWSFDERVEWRATILYLKEPVITHSEANENRLR